MEQSSSNPEPNEAVPPSLADQAHWLTEHTALFIATIKWTILGAISGICVGLSTRFFLWALAFSTAEVRVIDRASFRYYWLLPIALPVCVFLIRKIAPSARGHGTEAVIAAIHQRYGKVDWTVAPVKLLATVVTLSFGGSVGKEGPCAQIGAAVTSFCADLLKLGNEDRRRLVICGIGAGFAAVFGTPVSGALFGIEVLYLGRLEYPVLFPCLLAGIVSHLVCGVPPPVAHVSANFGTLNQPELIFMSLGFGVAFGVAALLLIEIMRWLAVFLRRYEQFPYVIAVVGGIALAALYSFAGERYAGLGVDTIDASLRGVAEVSVFAFLVKEIATGITLESGGSGGIVTPLFFIGATSGAGLAQLLHLPDGVAAAFGLVAVLAAAANTPIAAAVMGMELLPTNVGVYAALCACTAYLIVGHRSVYASQKLGFAKAAALEVDLDVPIGEIRRPGIRVKEGTLAYRVRHWRRKKKKRPPKPRAPSNRTSNSNKETQS